MIKQWIEIKPSDERYTEFFRDLGCDCEVEAMTYGYAKTLTLKKDGKEIKLVANSTMLEAYYPVKKKEKRYRIIGGFLGGEFSKDFPHTDDGFKMANDFQSKLDGGSRIDSVEVEVD